jgi:hypothetical protein
VYAFHPSHIIVTVLMTTVSPLSLLKNPMILIGAAALVFAFGMPKIMQNSMLPPPLYLLSMQADAMISGPRTPRRVRKTLQRLAHGRRVPPGHGRRRRAQFRSRRLDGGHGAGADGERGECD